MGVARSSLVPVCGLPSLFRFRFSFFWFFETDGDRFGRWFSIERVEIWPHLSLLFRLSGLMLHLLVSSNCSVSFHYSHRSLIWWTSYSCRPLVVPFTDKVLFLHSRFISSLIPFVSLSVLIAIDSVRFTLGSDRYWFRSFHSRSLYVDWPSARAILRSACLARRSAFRVVLPISVLWFSECSFLTFPGRSAFSSILPITVRVFALL